MLVACGARPLVLLRPGDWVPLRFHEFDWMDVVAVDRATDPQVVVHLRCGCRLIGPASCEVPVAREEFD